MVMKKSKKKNNLAISILIVLLICSLVGGAGAKYVFEKYGRGLFSAKVFYFESNLLKDKNVEYILNPTATSISFTISNSIDELRYADDDITWGYSVNGIVVEKDKVLEKGKSSSETITLSNLERGKSYVVKATGRAGYVKDIYATFTVSDTDKNIYQYLEKKDGYVVLTVWTENLSGEVTVSFPSGLIPDSTDEQLRSVHNYNENTGKYMSASFVDDISFSKVYSSKTYRFFVSGNNSVTVNDFSVSCNSNGQIVLSGIGSLK